MLGLNLLEWLGVIASICTVISFIYFLRERRKREKNDNHMNGFLHGIKSGLESMSKRTNISGDEILPIITQINDTLARLQPPKKKK